MSDDIIHILLVEDNKDFAKLVQVYLQRFQNDRFSVLWKQCRAEAIEELESNGKIDIILMDYFLPGRNGLEITREIKEKKIDIPIIFLTVNKDFDLALDVMKLGIDDYLVKEEVSSPLLPKTILSVIEKNRLKHQLEQAEITQLRLQAIRDTLSGMLNDFEIPLKDMREITESFKHSSLNDTHKNYLKIIDENVQRIVDKLEKLKTLKQDKTIKYIKDIKMLDLA